ncbi:cytochrome P450 [Fodinicola acaciae]|uniref:cytochrome P450 n=1 Tax=Fodinicola acaciae TaxID=2681555 RepID=UPI0013D45DF9|nr:cytochrome P450 [Fodinicola acaciae]
MTSVDDLRLAVRLTARRLATYALAGLGDDVCRLDIERYIADPYPLYESIRAKGPVYRSRTGYSAVTSHALCAKVLRDPGFGVQRVSTSQGPIDDTYRPLADAFLGLDPPDHTRLRRLAAPAFRPKLMQGYRARVYALAHRLLDEAQRRASTDGGFDLVADFAAPLPIAIICDLLGIRDADADRLARWGKVIGQSLDGIRSVAFAHELRAASAELTAMFAELIERRRRQPGEDVVSMLIAAEADGRLTVRELVATCQLLLIAGFETTVNLIGNATRLLLAHPRQWSLLREDPDLAVGVVEETLRYEPPVQLTERVSHAEVDLAGRRLPADSMVLVLIAAANRDPEVFPAADRFDITRERGVEHLTFSSGIHYCLGAPLARMEGEIALRVLAERMPRLRLSGPVGLRRSLTLRGPWRMPVAA